MFPLSSPPAGPATVLNVDDNDAARTVLTHVLRRAGFVVREAATATEALALVAQAPDFVLLDVQLPDGDGFDVCRRIKANPATAHVPVLLITAAHVQPHDQVRGLEVGADGYLIKPVEPDVIVAQVRALLRTHQAEEALRQSERQYRALAESIPQLVWISRADGTEEYVNRRLRDYVGAGPDDAPAWDWQAVHPDDRARSRRAWQRATQTGEPFEVEYRLRRADGAYRWHIARALPLSDGQGRVVQWFGTCTDIDDQKRAEAQRDELLARLQLQFERMPIGCIVTGRDGRYAAWNPAAERIFGYPAAEALGRTPFELLVQPGTEDLVRDSLRRLFAGDMDAHVTAACRTRDGRTVRCEWYNTPLRGPAGEVSGVLSMVLDVTERHRLEEQYRQAQKMEAVGRLAGGVAHDFNNLLTIINGYSELLLNRLPAGDANRAVVDEIRKAGERSASLTRQLLAFSRKAVVAPRLLDLNAVLADTEKMLRRIIGEDVELVTVPEPGVGCVRADPGQLEQALLNLAVNARDAMPQGGRLTLATAAVRLDAAYAAAHPGARPGRYVGLTVSDTGVGMPDEVKAHVFEPFFTTKGVGEGTGLGLAMVYGMVKQAGGHIEADSAPGRGSTFRLYLPWAGEAAGPGPSRSQARALPRGTGTVLLVEDDAGVRAFGRQVLQNSGYHVLEAEGGEQALAAAAGHGGPIDLLVTDVVMPGLGGRELAGRLLARHPGLKVLYLSGYTDDAVVRHGILQDQVAFLQKPFTPRALAYAAREALDAGGSGPANSAPGREWACPSSEEE